VRARPRKTSTGRRVSSVLLEAGYSASNAREHDQLLVELRFLPTTTATTSSSSVRSTRRRNPRPPDTRLPPVELLTGALAER
jgi:hypothetical protein